MSVENLKYLSSRQALADAANFIGALKAGTILPDLDLSKSKFVTFGGSYSGSSFLYCFKEVRKSRLNVG